MVRESIDEFVELIYAEVYYEDGSLVLRPWPSIAITAKLVNHYLMAKPLRHLFQRLQHILRLHCASVFQSHAHQRQHHSLLAEPRAT